MTQDTYNNTNLNMEDISHISCELNIDTACVELRFTDGTLVSMDCTAVENEVADNMYQRSEPDCLYIMTL